MVTIFTTRKLLNGGLQGFNHPSTSCSLNYKGKSKMQGIILLYLSNGIHSMFHFLVKLTPGKLNQSS